MDYFITNNWNKILNKFDSKQKDIYFTEEYLSLYETEDYFKECLIINEKNNYLLFPYLKNKIIFENKIFYDFETAYGYGGPIFNTDNENFINNAINLLFNILKKENFVAGFIRFHPVLKNYFYFQNNFENNIYFDRKTVSIDLTLSENEIWNHIHSKHRNVIRKAETENLEFNIDKDLITIDIFKKLYYNTMKDLNADDYYFFNDKYFKILVDKFKNSVFLSNVSFNNTIIASSLFLFFDKYAHYHLSGRDKDFLYLYPNNFLIYKTALFLKNLGIENFHLGGGTNSDENNSLYKFKKRFSKVTNDFYIGKFIFNEEIYTNLCNNWEKNNKKEKVDKYKNFLLKYRY